MSDPKEEGLPDGIVIVHFPSDGDDPYAVGPFPPIPDLVDFVIENAKCDCERKPMAIMFPPGVRMMVGVDLEEVVEQVKSILANGGTSDRLN